MQRLIGNPGRNKILPKPATRCPALLLAPPTPPAVRSQAEVFKALPSSLLSPLL
jgi:hypothetical protein